MSVAMMMLERIAMGSWTIACPKDVAQTARSVPGSPSATAMRSFAVVHVYLTVRLVATKLSDTTVTLEQSVRTLYSALSTMAAPPPTHPTIPPTPPTIHPTPLTIHPLLVTTINAARAVAPEAVVVAVVMTANAMLLAC
jgi:hypothetical protein